MDFNKKRDMDDINTDNGNKHSEYQDKDYEFNYEESEDHESQVHANQQKKSK